MFFFKKYKTIFLVLNIIKKKDFPHLFFCGQPGTGKTTISMIISKILYGEDVYDMVMHVIHFILLIVLKKFIYIL